MVGTTRWIRSARNDICNVAKKTLTMANWRYKLPCGHHTYRYRPDTNKKGSAINGTSQGVNSYYKCGTCGKTFPHKIDKKTNEKIEPKEKTHA
jgi:uncharacterized CHY-type Zn-finger protein